MAWLHAVPKPPEGSKRAKLKGQAAEISRLDRLKRDGVKPSMPPNPLPHTILRLVEMGITEAAGMGAAPLSWITIDAWQRTTGVDAGGVGSPADPQIVDRIPGREQARRKRNLSAAVALRSFPARAGCRGRDAEKHSGVKGGTAE
jgi:hypothetical protein